MPTHYNAGLGMSQVSWPVDQDYVSIYWLREKRVGKGDYDGLNPGLHFSWPVLA